LATRTLGGINQAWRIQSPSGLHEEGMWFLNFHLQQFFVCNLGQKSKNRSIIWLEENA